jgi:hypothetical protein
MQVTHITSFQGDVCYIADPQTVRLIRLKVSDEILPLMIAMIGVGRTSGFGRRKHQSMATKKFKELVTPGQVFLAIDSA